MEEVRQAVEPRKGFFREGLSWAMALAAGLAILSRSFETARKSPERLQGGELTAAETRTAQALPAAPAARAETDHAARAESPPEAAGQERVTGGWQALVKELYKRFNEDEGFMRAAALAFWGILSLVPLLLFALAALGFVIRDPQQAAEYVQRFITQLLPGRQAAEAAQQVIAQTHIVESAQSLIHARWWAAVLGLLSLVWTGIGLFVNASAPMNAAWDVKETRSFVTLRLVALGVFAGAGVLFLLSLLPSSGPNTVRNLHIPWLGLPEHVPFWVDLLFALLAVALNIGMFVLIYRFLPNAPVTWKAALFGGAVIGVLWELFKKGFAVYLTNFGNFNKLYGTLGGIVLLVTWVYYSCVILLIGATLAKMYHEHKEEGGVQQRPPRPEAARAAAGR
jgi:membrane protein